MPIPTRAELRARFAQALQIAGERQPSRSSHQPDHVIRAAVEVVLGDPAKDVKDLVGTTTARHRAAFQALADSIQGGD
jgi:hypothetical protein